MKVLEKGLAAEEPRQHHVPWRIGGRKGKEIRERKEISESKEIRETQERRNPRREGRKKEGIQGRKEGR